MPPTRLTPALISIVHVRIFAHRHMYWLMEDRHRWCAQMCWRMDPLSLYYYVKGLCQSPLWSLRHREVVSSILYRGCWLRFTLSRKNSPHSCDSPMSQHMPYTSIHTLQRSWGPHSGVSLYMKEFPVPATSPPSPCSNTEINIPSLVLSSVNWVQNSRRASSP